jgi:CHAD domain-containing protein
MDAHLEHLQKLTATLRGNLEKCASVPDIDPVHDLRTGTRRVQAMVEAIERERGEGSAADTDFSEAVSRWLRVLKKLRRAAAPVRDLDVHRKLLKKLVKFGGDEQESGPEMANNGAELVIPPPDIVEEPAASLPTSSVEHQADHLDAWLRHARQHQAAALKKRAGKELPKFDAEAAAFQAAVSRGRRSRRRPRSAAIVALESFARLVDQMQQLDAGNLHDFRKGAKKARYIAESAAEDAYAAGIGKALKKLQDDIGDWHDWLVLAEEARTALDDETAELIVLLDGERDRHYVFAMKTVERLRGKLLGEWQASMQSRSRAVLTPRALAGPARSSSWAKPGRHEVKNR